MVHSHDAGFTPAVRGNRAKVKKVVLNLLKLFFERFGKILFTEEVEVEIRYRGNDIVYSCKK